ncbi:hypothetical protein H0H92_013189, partial [Tricholoma furcatifolium]
MSINLINAQAVGYDATTATIFNDLQDAGYWPSKEYITRIEGVVLYGSTSPNTVDGIETTYLLASGKTRTLSRGDTSSSPGLTVDLSASPTKYIAGIFGVQDSGSQPVLRSLGFLVYDTTDGSLTPNGPFPALAGTNTVGFSVLGEIVGFSGTTGGN